MLSPRSVAFPVLLLLLTGSLLVSAAGCRKVQTTVAPVEEEAPKEEGKNQAPVGDPLPIGAPVKPAEREPDLDAGQVMYATLRATLAEKTESNEAVAFSPDGKLLVSAGRDKMITIWDLPTGKVKRTLPGHTDYIKFVAFSPDGKTLASASGDDTIRLWDVATGRMLRSLKDTSGVYIVRFAPNGKTLASVNSRGDVKLWDLETGTLRATAKEVTQVVLDGALDYSPDGKTLATAAKDKGHNVLLLDGTTGEVRQTLKADGKRVRTVAFAPDGTLASVDDDDRKLKLWDLQTGKEKQTISFEGTAQNGLAFSPGGLILAHSGYDIKLWNPATGKLRATVYWGFSGHVSSFAFSPDGNAMAVVDNHERMLRIWDLEISKEKRTVAHDGAVQAVAGSPDGQTFATAGRKPVIEIRDLKTGETKKTLEDAGERIAALTYSPDGTTLVSAGREGLIFWDVAAGKKRFAVPERTECICYAPDGKTLAAGVENGILMVNAVTGKEQAVLDGHRHPVRCLAFSPDGKTLASGAQDATVRLWDVAAGKTRLTLDAHEDAVRCVAFSPDGKTLATASGNTADKLVRLWDATTGKEIRALEGHREGVTGLVFLDGGKSLLSTGADRSLRLWDVETGKQRSLMLGDLEVGIAYLTLFPDGKVLAANTRNKVKLWETADVLRGPSAARTDIVRHEPEKEPDELPTFASLRRQLKGHEGSADDVTYSKDGRWLATAGKDKTVKLWDAQTGKVVRAFTGHTDEVTVVVFSPDGKLLASTGKDKTIKLWNVETGAAVHTIGGHKEPVMCLAFSPDGATLASGTEGIAEAELKLWNVSTGREKRSWPMSGRVNTVAFAPDGKTLAAGMLYSKATLYDPETGAEKLTLKCSDQVYAVTFSPDGSLLVTGGGGMQSSELRIWDARTGKQLHELKGHPRGVLSVAFSRDGKLLASFGLGHSVLFGALGIWDAGTGASHRMLFGSLQNRNIGYKGIAFSADGQTLASASSEGGAIQLWNVPDLLDTPMQQAAGHILRVGGTVERKEKLIHMELAINGRLTAEAVTHLKGIGKPFALSLRASRNLTDATLGNLTGLDHMHALILSGRDVTDVGLTHLKGLSNLESLDLSGTRITDAGLAHLKGLSRLKVLDVGNTGVTPEGVQGLKKSLPGVEVRGVQ